MDASGDGGGHTADEPGWDLDLVEDDSGPVIAAVGRQIRLWREAAGLRAAELGAAIGYGENQVYKVEAGKRIPKPEFLEQADTVLRAGGRISAMQKDIEQARYPRKVRDLAKLEAEATELGAYGNHNMHGLLQTEEYARALFDMRHPAYSEDEVERHVAARMARQEIFARRPAPTLTFVQEEVTLRRPIGGLAVLRQQLEHLLQLGRLRNVLIQIMPTAVVQHGGMGGQIQVLKMKDGSTAGHWEAQLASRVVSDPKQVHILELRHGIIRSQALTPCESLAFIEKVLGET